MTDQDDEEKQNMRIMWIASGVIVLFLLGIMGVSMLNDKGTGPTEMSSIRAGSGNSTIAGKGLGQPRPGGGFTASCMVDNWETERQSWPYARLPT